MLTMRRPLPQLFTLALVLVPGALQGQVTMGVEEYQPRSTLRVPEHLVTRARFPFVDVHGHQGGLRTAADVDALVAKMDALNMRAMVNLSGGSGERLATPGASHCRPSRAFRDIRECRFFRRRNPGMDGTNGVPVRGGRSARGSGRTQDLQEPRARPEGRHREAGARLTTHGSPRSGRRRANSACRC